MLEAPVFSEYMRGGGNVRVLAGLSGPFDAKLARGVVGKVGLTDRIDSKVAA